MTKYFEMIENATTLDELDEIVENASFDNELTNDEYTEIYAASLNKAQTW